MPSVVIIYHSGFGHTAKQAQAVERGAASVAGITTTLLSVSEVSGNWEKLDAADALIFGCPTYMGSASAPFKEFIDSTSKRWFEQAWKDKLAAGFTNSSSYSGDKLNTLLQIFSFAMQHSMLWVGLDIMPNIRNAEGQPLNRCGSYSGAMATSTNESPEVTPPADDLAVAERLGARVAEFARRLRP